VRHYPREFRVKGILHQQSHRLGITSIRAYRPKGCEKIRECNEGIESAQPEGGNEASYVLVRSSIFITKLFRAVIINNINERTCLMKPRIKIGLVSGIIGLLLTISVSVFGNVYWSPIVFFLTGGIASFYTIQQEKPQTRSGGARAGATTGSIAGILVMLGLFIGSLLILLTPPTAAEISSPGVSNQIGYEVGQACSRSFCIGFPLALLIGAFIGYLATPKRPQSDLNSSDI